MKTSSKIRRTVKYLRRNWFSVTLIIMAAMLMVKKDMSINFRIKDPVEKTDPSGKHRADKKKGSNGKVSENNTTVFTPKVDKGNLSDPFRMSSKIPDITEKEENKSTELNGISDTDVAIFVDRFGNVATAEQKRYGIPASIILAQAIINSNAGTSDLAKQGNNYFNLPCGQNWSGEAVNLSTECYRKYETAWFSFRDNSLFLSGKQFNHLFNLSPSDYQTWAKGLEVAGFPHVNGYADMLVRTIEQFDLIRFN